MAPGQSPGLLWRKRRMEGYQMLSSRATSQRQSTLNGNRAQTGLPSAPARCAGAELSVIKRSKGFDKRRAVGEVRNVRRRVEKPVLCGFLRLRAQLQGNQMRPRARDNRCQHIGR